MTIHTETSAVAASPEAEAFYAESLRQLRQSSIPFLLGGTFAVCSYTGLNRPTKDLDVFCRAGDYPRILNHFQRLGCDSEVEDERWIAKVRKGDYFFDVIFNSTTAVTPINEHWFAEAHTTRVYGVEVQITPPTELVWSKVFVQDRTKYDGADIAHLILRQHPHIDWRRLLSYMDQYWEVLLIHILNFRFIYPTERECVPRWILDELLKRLEERANLPVAQMKVCRGRLYSRNDYQIDVSQWGYADVVGEPHRHPGQGERKP
ncbi:MAG: hypothetical protein K2Q10_13040 [Rhodospirillales bacterium]|nr:hypothetical protein [Rhodospirillales bacterium]